MTKQKRIGDNLNLAYFRYLSSTLFRAVSEELVESWNKVYSLRTVNSPELGTDGVNENIACCELCDGDSFFAMVYSNSVTFQVHLAAKNVPKDSTDSTIIAKTATFPFESFSSFYVQVLSDNYENLPPQSEKPEYRILVVALIYHSLGSPSSHNFFFYLKFSIPHFYFLDQIIPFGKNLDWKICCLCAEKKKLRFCVQQKGDNEKLRIGFHQVDIEETFLSENSLDEGFQKRQGGSSCCMM